MSSAGASISLDSGTNAAGWASQVGNQNERISRLAWYREPAPPSNPSKEGACKNKVLSIPSSRWQRVNHPTDAARAPFAQLSDRAHFVLESTCVNPIAARLFGTECCHEATNRGRNR